MEKIYAGSGKVVKTQFGDLTKISFSKTDLEKLIGLADQNKGWVNLVLKEKKDKVEGKPTHYLEVDQWKPSGQASQTVTATTSTEDNLPF